VALVDRPNVGSDGHVYLADAKNLYIPVDGDISQWQYYAKTPGTVTVQVWRRVGNANDKM
jgi:hypothetical protein